MQKANLQQQLKTSTYKRRTSTKENKKEESRRLRDSLAIKSNRSMNILATGEAEHKNQSIFIPTPAKKNDVDQNINKASYVVIPQLSQIVNPVVSSFNYPV